MHAKRVLLVCVGLSLAAFAPAEGQRPTIVAREVSGWFFVDGKMKADTPSFEFVYEIQGDTLIRRSVRNLQTGKTEVDDTRYEVLTDLTSYNPEALRFKKLPDLERNLGPVVRAMGRPGSDAVEVLFIGPDWVQSVKTVRNYMVISRLVRTQ
jgi:hypothetical protein